ncbi:GNAT family N-acetyltransferase [Pelagibius sp. Alg239-R121]|uniref:GNAT family N-acetyltransferase n=1 Tax=Pelagibius sp. Alg239-R121 TaxID=2993448 RepID=UPI0024A79F0D|nr:GNAT family N-acetyltransferase [Pelagibius sp. Alg239-R121]
MITVREKPEDFDDWPELLDLLQESYAYMDSRIDPPSSLHRLDARSLAEKSRDEILILALEDKELAGCCFVKPAGDVLYVGKLAINPARQGQGIGRKLIDFSTRVAQQKGCEALELETRIELVENHRAFSAMGFRKTAETAHRGYNRPTSITMRMELSANADRPKPTT